MKLTLKNNLKTCLRHLVVHQTVCKRHRILPFLNYWMNTKQPVTSTFTTTVQEQSRAIIELRSIADHRACTTAWSQRTASFDRPVRTGDVLKFQVVHSPVRSAPGRSKTSKASFTRSVWTRPYW